MKLLTTIKTLANWAFFWRISTIMSGVAMLVVAPYHLADNLLAVFYSIYSLSAYIALVDFGLSTRFLVAAGDCLESDFRVKTAKAVMFRCFIIFVPTVLYVKLLLERILVSQFNKFIPLVLGFIFVLNYFGTLMISYVEGNIDNRLSYRWRTIGEILAAIVLVGALQLGFSIDSIVIFIFVRSIVPIIGLYSICLKCPRNLGSVKVKQGFELKSGIVMLLGYVSSHGLLNAVLWLYGEKLSAAFSQAYLMFSSVFSICMGLLIYQQKNIKEKLINNGVAEMGWIRKDFQLQIQRLFKISAAILLFGTIILQRQNMKFLKFGWEESLAMSLVFWWTINHSVVAIIFRMTGNEKTFFVSVISFVGILVSVFIAALLNNYILLLALLVLVSYLVNKLLVDKVASI